MINKTEITDAAFEQLYTHIRENDDEEIIDFLYLCGQELIEDVASCIKIPNLKRIGRIGVLDYIKACLSVQKKITDDAMLKKIYNENPWEIFNEIYKDDKKYLTFLKDKEYFESFYNACCRIKLNHDNVVDNITLRHIKDELNKINNDINWQEKMMFFILDDMFIFLDKIDKYRAENNNVLVDFKTVKKKIINLYNGINDINDCIFDAVNVFEYDNESNDYCLENLKIYYDYMLKVDAFSKNNELIIFDPSAQFITKIIRDPYFIKHKFRFVISKNEHYKIYKLSEKNNKRIIFNTLDEILKYLRLSSKEGNNILMFCNHNNAISSNNFIRELIENDISINTFYMFGTDNIIENNIDTITKISGQATIKAISLFPYEINNQTSPKRKMSIEIIFNDKKDRTDKIKIIQYKTADLKEKSQYIERKNVIVEIDNDELINRSNQIRSIYRNEERNRDSNRDNKEEYSFSTNLTIKYGIREANNKYRLDAIFLWNNKKIKLNNTKASKTGNTKEDLINWMQNDYPYLKNNKVDIRKEVSNQCLRLANYDDTDLKTLLYLNQVFEKDIDSLEDLNNVLNTKIGNLIVNSANDDDIEVFSENNYYGYQIIEYMDNTISLLSQLYDAAIKRRLVKNNPFKVYSERLSSEEKAKKDIKYALVVRHFSINEFNEIYKDLLSKYNRGSKKALALIIRLLTGIESYSVNCLQWKDFRIIEDFNNEVFYQILVRRRTDANGKAVAELGKLEKYRRIPISDLLSNILLRERERQLKAYDFHDVNQLDDYMIISGGNKIYKDKIKVYSPWDIEDYKRKVLEKFKIEDEIELIYSDNKKEKIDLSNYNRDIFRKNYEFYAIDKCGFDRSEIAYLLGNKQDITFARNYCDYANVCSQLILKIKQDRLAVLCIEDAEEFSKIKSTNKGYIKSDSDNKNKTELVFHVEKNISDLEFEVKTKYGYKVSILPIKENDDDY